MDFNKIINNIINKKPNKSNFGASLKMQNKWKTMPSNSRNKNRMLYKDSDGDRVPDKFDCSPNNIMRQDWSKVGGTGVPVWTYPRSFGYRRRLVNMPPEKFLQLAKKGYTTEEARNIPDEEHEERITEQYKIDIVKPILDSEKGRVDIPVLEVKRGKFYDHEGRHRSISAKQLGHDTMPVYIVERDKNYIKNIEKNKRNKALKWEQKDPLMKEVEDEHELSKNAFRDDEDEL